MTIKKKPYDFLDQRKAEFDEDYEEFKRYIGELHVIAPYSISVKLFQMLFIVTLTVASVTVVFLGTRETQGYPVTSCWGHKVKHTDTPKSSELFG